MLQAIISLILTISSVGGHYSVSAAPIPEAFDDDTYTYYQCQAIDGTNSCHEYVYRVTDIEEQPALLFTKHYTLDTDAVITLLQTLGETKYVLTLQNVEVSNYFTHYPKED